MNIKKIIVAALVIGSLLAAYIWFFVYNKPHVDYQETDAAYVGHADSLHAEAVQNPTDFTENYVNEAVEIEGTVVEVGTSAFRLGNGMICTIDTNYREFLPTVGEVVTVKGRVVGTDEDILTAEIICNLDRCVVVSKQ